MSRGSTPRPRRRSSRRSRSERRSSPATSTARASREITAADITAARDLGYVVKLLAVAEELDGSIAVRVHPAMIPSHHPLASVRGSFNAVFIEGAAVGELMLYGRGAGGGPTAVAVLGDLVDAAKNLRSGAQGATFGTLTRIPIHPIDEVESQFYVTVDVADRPGVLAAIAGVFGKHDVSIQSMQQARSRRRGPPDLRHPPRARGRPPGDDARGRRARRGRAGRKRPARRRRRRMTPHEHAQPWPGIIEAYRDRLPVDARHSGRHAARRRNAARPGAAAVGAGARRGVPEGRRARTRPVRSRTAGMTLAITKALESGREGRRVRVDGQHVGFGRRVLGARRPRRRGAHPRRSRRAREARAGVDPRRARRADPRQLRRRAPHRARARRARRGHGRQLDQPVPHRGSEDGGVRGVRRARAPARRALPSGRERGQHHRVLEGLRRVRRPTAS